jgi:hypothetical protein
MKAVSKIMTGAVGMAALVGMAAPAAAQYYPGYNTGGNVVGQVLSTILNPYGQQQQYGYGINPQAAVQQCSAAVQNRLARSNAGYNPYGGYNGYGYASGYNNAYSNARVLQVTRVEPRSNTTMRVRGLASSGTAAAYSPYGNNGGYGGYGGYAGYGGYNTAAAADLTFKCDVDYRGYIRDIDIDRRR